MLLFLLLYNYYISCQDANFIQLPVYMHAIMPRKLRFYQQKNFDRKRSNLRRKQSETDVSKSDRETTSLTNYYPARAARAG